MNAALRLPYFAAALERQAQPKLVGQPLALARPDSARTLAVSREAEDQSIVTGMSIVGAQALCPDLHIVRRHPAALRRQFEMVLDALTEFSDQIEAEEALPRVRKRGRSLPYAHPTGGSDQPPALCTQEVGGLRPDSGFDFLIGMGQFVQRHFDLSPCLSLAQDKFTARTAALGRDLQRLARGQDSSPVQPYTPVLAENLIRSENQP